ncbi:diguanylate cyclase (GGDEF) domain-containing protein [Alkaliphilus peptidifermentans DSM 18978]|uniref:Diguanylate cyclase (GGDEF) domain-containing protein n=2 Tax=Alkaliphilus TaxID=114627 RepID=A0A1G5L8F6_9FIRM|nr:diguanylate cyclase (GGDEF) domain-containing protein [Alkaliphilus peptidifermentans DSM 18978]
MKRISDVMIKDLVVVDFLDGIQKIKSLHCNTQSGNMYFPVKDNGEIVGITSVYQLINVHPNRIVADAMTTHYITISPNDSLWKAHEVFVKTQEGYLVVKDKDVFLGVLPKNHLYIELGKYTDPLTGLYRSDYIYYKASNLILEGNELTVVFLDVNDFGKIDKEYGHVQGDIILKELSELIRDLLPSDTHLCRFGGDEFVFISTKIKSETVEITNDLLNKVSLHSFSDAIPVTLSAGIAGGNRINKRNHDVISTISSLINLASLASTKAKKGSSSIYALESDYIA